jgi:Zn-dependent protease with chaperone function
MIYTNFLFFIVAIIAYVLAPLGVPNKISYPFNLYGIFLLFLGFWHFNKVKFLKLREALEKEEISIEKAKKYYLSTVNKHLAGAVVLFVLEIFLFDLKKLLVQAPGAGQYEVFSNAVAILVFILHLAVVWYWAFQAVGEVLSIGKSAVDYILGNVKFNIVIAVPWLLLMAAHDMLNIEAVPIVLQIAIMIVFMVGIAIIAPLLVVRLWDCEPLEDSELKREIAAYCQSRGVKFKEIMSWNALHRSLVTAGVMGLVYPFRYLLITPELLRVLNKDELLAVVSHEVGHVKKKHLYYYLLFFIGFLFVGMGSDMWLNSLLTTPAGLAWYQSLSPTSWSFIKIFFTLFLFVVYFRFIFGYFVRNFERQADVYCFESGVNPDHMVSSFEKLARHLGDDGNKSNWHHYNIPQRIEFIRKSQESREHIVNHNRRIKRSVMSFIAILVIFAVSTISPYGLKTLGEIELGSAENALQQRILQEPNNPRWYTMLGAVSFELKKWEQTRSAYERTLELEYRQPGVLNNLAWFYLKCPDEEFLDRRRALELARDAIRLQQAPHIFDTLAEAYFQNSMYKEAYAAAKRALATAEENFKYYRDQLQKMRKYYTRFKSTIKI